MNMKDYEKGLIWNSNEENSFAIEPEISAEFYYNVIENYYEDYKEETGCVYELLAVHDMNEELRLKLYKDISEFYKDKFSIGEDEKLSGGTHFVLFGEFAYLKEKGKDFKYKILNCPLHLKSDGQGQLFGRDMEERCTFSSRDEIRYGSKGTFLTLKDELFSNHEETVGTPIEFRCNNVFDERILGYYQGLILAVEQGVKFKKTSDELRRYAKYGDTEYYHTEGDLHFSHINGHIIGEDDKKTISYNTKLIINLLKEKGLVNSADKFEEYCKEFNL